jgi:hypothetical protein
VSWPPNGLELSCPAEAGKVPLLYGTPTGAASSNQGPARRVSFSELLGATARVLGHSTKGNLDPLRRIDAGQRDVSDEFDRREARG